MFVFTGSGRVDVFLAFQVARVVRRWALLTGRSQVPMAYGVLATGAALYSLLVIKIMIRMGDPFISVMVGLAFVSWGLIIWQCHRALRYLETIRLEDGGISVDLRTAAAIHYALKSRTAWGCVGLIFGLLSLLLHSPLAVMPAALGISASYYVMLCVTPSSGTPVWQRGRERLLDAAKRLTPVPAPGPA